MAKSSPSSSSASAAGAVANVRPEGNRWSGRIRVLFFLVPALVMTPQTMFQRKLLPLPVARFIGRIYFWPTLPFTLYRRWKEDALWTEVDDTVMLGVSPVAILGFPEQLHGAGVRGVVNMQDEYAGPLASYDSLGVRQLHLPTLDHYEPTLEDLRSACAFIDEHRARGEKVYVHCKAGHGRGAAVALAWMAYSRRPLNEEDLDIMNGELLQKRRVRATLSEQPILRAFADWIRDGGADRTWEWRKEGQSDANTDTEQQARKEL
mmetsp:Transcript_60334/g.127777  ORF Transcript_60334/g.127777 Transcript_60334/m.127777 type:complete len:263 (+) Transcript_60334:33-821(+)